MSWANVRRAAWIALFTTLFALGVAKVNLFGLESSLGDRADDVAQRVGIVGYPLKDVGVPRAGQDRVRVIHIDDEGLVALKAYWPGWPPGYENLAVMIEDVAKAPRIQPARAVFVDLEITGENLTQQTEGEFDELIESLGRLTRAGTLDEPGWNAAPACHNDPLTVLACMVEWGGTPVILAGGENLTPPERGPRARLATVALIAPTLIDARNYPLADPVSKGPRPQADDRYTIYPATAMYAVDCLVRAKALGHDACRIPAIERARIAALALKQDPDAAPRRIAWGEVEESWAKPEAVIWSSDASPRQDTLWRQTSGNYEKSCVSRPSLWDRTIGQALGDRGPTKGRQEACVYTLSLGYDRLVAGMGLSRDRDYPDLLGDKLILIGSQFRSSDWTPTPLHGALPGVQYHAMALDNLLEFGRSYRRNEGPGLGRGDLFASTLTFLLLFAVNLASIEKRRITGVSGRLKPWAAIAWYGGLALVTVVGLTAFIIATNALWRDVIVNWIGILATVFAAVWFTAKNDISGDVAGWMNRSRTGRAVVKAVAAFDNSLRPDPSPSRQDKP